MKQQKIKGYHTRYQYSVLIQQLFKGTLAMLLFFLFTAPLKAQSKVETIRVSVSIYCDHCKQCGSCGSRLENAVYSLKGIKRVDVDEKTKTVIVVYNPKKVTRQQIKRAIAQVGFDADDVKADPTAYTKLDECCKKQ